MYSRVFVQDYNAKQNMQKLYILLCREYCLLWEKQVTYEYMLFTSNNNECIVINHNT